MAGNRKAVATLIMVNLTILAMVSTTVKATCPTLNVCASIPLVNVRVGSQAGTQCCSLISGIASANVEVCLCSLLKQSALGSTLATTLGLTSGLINLNLLSPLLAPLYTLTYSVLDSEIVALVNACGFNPDDYHCASY